MNRTVLCLSLSCTTCCSNRFLFSDEFYRQCLRNTAGFAKCRCAYLKCRAFFTGSLAGTLALQAQLNEQLQQVYKQLIHLLLSLQVSCDVSQSINHSQGAMPANKIPKKTTSPLKTTQTSYRCCDVTNNDLEFRNYFFYGMTI